MNVVKKDFYSYWLEKPIVTGGATIGTASFKYEVNQIIDTYNLESRLFYRVKCTHRISLPNPNGFSLTPSKITSYDQYPGLIELGTTFKNTNLELRLTDYQPKTLNTAVMASSTNDSGTNKSFSHQHTSGSTTSQTNTYDVNMSLGFAGDVPMGSIGGGYSHSTSHSHEHSNTNDHGHGSHQGVSDGDSMSIKDWGSYASLDANRISPKWVWGQEYPWDIVQYRSCSSGNSVDLPDFVQKRLFDKWSAPTLVYPPSHLSLFGVDFTMKAVWDIVLPDAIADQTIQLSHDLSIISASHGIDSSGKASATLNSTPAGMTISSPDLDLTLLGLDPIRHGDANNGAVIGFAGDKYLQPPKAGAAFKILSVANNLQVSGTGFNAGMSTDFGHGPAKIKLRFKIIDDEFEYSLFMKHWCLPGGTAGLKISCNGFDISRSIEALEGEGGENNLLALNLRNKDYSSIEYHDYLVIGLNTIEITVSPNASPASGGYQLRAIAIGAE